MPSGAPVGATLRYRGGGARVLAMAMGRGQESVQGWVDGLALRA